MRNPAVVHAIDFMKRAGKFDQLDLVISRVPLLAWFRAPCLVDECRFCGVYTMRELSSAKNPDVRIDRSRICLRYRKRRAGEMTASA
jgi:hypothetical protein